MAVVPESVMLTCGCATAELAPAVGGRLMRWSIDGRPVLHWPEAADWSRAGSIRGGNPLLFPFIARTFLDGKIGFWRGPDGQVRPAPMHGLVRTARFEVEVLATDRIRLRIASDETMAGSFPFPFVFTVEYVLEDGALSVAFTAENTGSESMPWSVGNHFYFDVPAEERGAWRLECPCRRFARQDKDGKIVQAAPPAAEDTLADPKLVDLFHVGPAREGVVLRHDGDGRSVHFDLPADAAGHDAWYAVTTWAETEDSEFYCVEPWSALPDAVHNGQGLRWLKPGTRETLRLRLRAEGW
jgi:galactose mutarotase-like enzyme